ncbi:hypothetical protein JKF63_02589 [Porcisia hertigi]|uniref:Membrane associated protein-like protein n=1 Tax=Porcisia hertigi TaxID=2761500 RepID=A0A836IJY8_9TRYP|nr:hypothetical protein JKF63_02589 [Porcisia hertigi]
MWGFLNNVRESLRHVVAPPPTANHARSAAAATTSTPPTTNVEEKGLEQTLDQLTAGVFRVWHKLDQTATKLFTQALDSAAPLREDATPKLFSLTADACASLPDEDLLELLVDAVSQTSDCARQALDEANFLLSLGVEEQIAHTTDYLGCYKWWDHTVNRRLLVCQNLMKDRFTDAATTTPAHVETVRTVYERIEKIRHSSTAPMAAVAARGRLLEDERYDLLKSFPSTYPANDKVQPRDVGVSAVASASSALNDHLTAPLTPACDTDSEKSVVPTVPHLDSAHTEKPSSVSLSSTTSPEPNTHSNAAPSLGNRSTPSFLEPPHPLPAFSEQLHLAEEQARLERIAEEERLAREAAAEEQARLERIAEEERLAREAAAEEQARLERIAEEQARLERIAEEERLAREAAAEEQARLERIAAEEQARLERIAAEEQARLERIAAEEQARLERIAEEERLAREAAAEEQARLERIAEEERVAREAAAEEQARLERIAEEERLAREAAAEEQARLERIAEEERLAREAAAEEQARLERIAEEERLAREAAEEEQARLERIAEEERLAREAAQEEQARLERIAAEEQARLERIAAEERLAREAAAEEQARLERIAEEERLAREAAAEEQARLERIAEEERVARDAAAEEQARLERIAEEERLAREAAAEEQARLERIAEEGVERAKISRNAQEAWAIMYGDFVLAAHLIASAAPNTARSHGATGHRAPAVNGDDGWGDDDDFEEVNMDACRLHVNSSEHRLSWSGTSPSNSSCLPHATPHAETTPLAQRNVGMVPKKRTPPSTPLPRAGERAVTETPTANQGRRSGGMSLRKKSPLARAAPAVATPVSALSSCASPGNRGTVSSPYSAVLNPTAGAVGSPRAYQQMVLTTPSSAAKQSRRSVRLEEGDNWDDDW